MSLADDWDSIPAPKESAAPRSVSEEWDSVPSVKAVVASKPKGYWDRLGAAAKTFNESGKGVADTIDAVGENLMTAATSPIGLLKHGVEEGAYLSGQSPEVAAQTAQRVIPVDPYAPQGESGKALAGLVGTAVEPVVNAGRWAAEKVGLSPAAQNIAGDFAPVVAPKLVSAAIKAPSAIKSGLSDAKNAAGAMGDRFQELQRIGRGEVPVAAIEPVITPQMMRGQEPIPNNLMQQAAEPQASNLSPIPDSAMAKAAIVPASPPAPKPAPAITIENASPELKKTITADEARAAPRTVERHLEADSLPIPIRLTKGQATGDLAQLSDEFNMRAKQPELAKRFNEQNSQLIENMNAIRERVAPDVSDVNHVDNGAALIDSYNKINAAREAQVSANYKALADANNGQIPVDGKAFAEAANKALGNGLVNKREFLPPTVEKIVQRIGDSDQQMTFDDFTTLRTILAKEAQKASRAGDGNASHAISVVRNELENIPMGKGAEALKPLADAAKESAKALFKDIEADPAWDAAINGKVTPDNFVKKFVINGPRDHVTRMKENIGADPIANQTIAASALNYLKERAGVPNDSGNFSQAGYNKALTAINPKIEALLDPVAAQQIQTLGKVARYTQEQPRGSYFNNSNTFTAAAKGTAKAAVEGALNIKTYGLSGAIKGAIEAGKQSRSAQEALQPGAGVKISELTKPPKR